MIQKKILLLNIMVSPIGANTPPPVCPEIKGKNSPSVPDNHGNNHDTHDTHDKHGIVTQGASIMVKEFKTGGQENNNVRHDDKCNNPNTNKSKTVSKPRCQADDCRRKLGLTQRFTNKCRCQLVFCDHHRGPEKHSCNYDYKTSGREILKARNPQIVAQKIKHI